MAITKLRRHLLKTRKYKGGGNNNSNTEVKLNVFKLVKGGYQINEDKENDNLYLEKLTGDGKLIRIGTIL
jgi:hypothetical protein